jgi:hypothetical protein
MRPGKWDKDTIGTAVLAYQSQQRCRVGHNGGSITPLDVGTARLVEWTSQTNMKLSYCICYISSQHTIGSFTEAHFLTMSGFQAFIGKFWP